MGEAKAPMPGLIVVIDVEEGERVKKGQQLLIIEAMKMENPISSPADGIVSDIRIEPGQAVDKGALLMVIKDGGENA